MGRWLEVPVGSARMRAFVATPVPEMAPGILLCMHGPGIDEFIQDIAERLARSGVAAIAPDFYHRQTEALPEPWTRIRDSEALADLTAARKRLEALPGVDATRIGVMGFCMGGRLAFLCAANDPSLRAAVVFHGGNILVSKDGAPSPFSQAARITAPLLGLFGAEDTNPTVDDVAKIDAELTRLGKRHEFHVFPGAGHAFLNFTRPAVFRPAQAEEAWALSLAWLKTFL